MKKSLRRASKPSPRSGFVLTVGGQKGGSMKSTTAISLAVHWSEGGARVLLVDLDPQGTATAWRATALAARVAASPTVLPYHAGPDDPLDVFLRREAEGCDLVVLDCPPAHGALQRSAMVLSNLAVLTCSPGGPDLWGMPASIAEVQAAHRVNPRLYARTLITRRTRTVVAAQLRPALERLPLGVLETELSERATYREAIIAGQGPTTYAPGSSAAHEVIRLARELEALASEASR